MKVIDLETVEDQFAREHIQGVVDTVCQILRVYKTRVHVKDERLYILTFYFMNNYRYSKAFNADTLDHCFMSDTIRYGARIVEEVKRHFLIEKGLTYI